MHVAHIIVVEGVPDEDESYYEGAVNGILEPYAPDVFDWWQVGGRFSWILEKLKKDLGRDVPEPEEIEKDGCQTWVSAEEDPELFKAAIERAEAWQSLEFRRARNSVFGLEVDEEDIETLGLGTNDPASVARKQTDRAKSDHRRIQELKEMDRCPALDDPISDLSLSGHRLIELGNLTAGTYCVDSRFYDSIYHSPSTVDVWERFEDEEQQAGVAVIVDGHY